MKKRLISVLLCIAMTLSLLPVGAMAENNSYTIETDACVLTYSSVRGPGTLNVIGYVKEAVHPPLYLISLPKDSTITDFTVKSDYYYESFSQVYQVSALPDESQYLENEWFNDTGRTYKYGYRFRENLSLNEGCSIPDTGVKGLGINVSDSDDNTVEALAIQVLTASQAEVTIGSGEGRPGTEIDIPVSITGNTGFAAFNAGMVYDSDALELLGYEVSGYLLDGAQVGTKVAYAHADNDCNSDGVLFVARFKIKNSAPNGNYEIGMLCDDWYDAQFDEDFEYAVENGNIFVSRTGHFETEYAVSIGEDCTVAAGETALVTINLEGKNSTTYNAIDMTISYDENSLSFIEPEIDGIEFDTSKQNEIRIVGYGNDKAVGEIFSLSFVGLKPGTSVVSITSAKFDEKANAPTQDIPEASIMASDVEITVSAYTVLLGSGANGESIALPGQDYTFTLSNTQLYDYDLHVIVGGIDITENVVNVNDTYTIPGNLINGNIEVSTGKTGKTFSVTLNDNNLDGEDHAQYGVNYAFDLTGKNGYTAGVTITIGGIEYIGYDIEGSIYTIRGIDITGDIVVNVTWVKVEPHFTKITVVGNAAGRLTEDLGRWEKSTDGSNVFVSKTEEADSFYFTLNRYGLYEYAVSASRADGTPVAIVPHVDAMNYQSFEIEAANLKEDVILTVNRVASGTCEMSEYVKLDGKVMYLVTVSGKREKGTYLFDGEIMPWSDTYNAYCYLIIGDTTMTNDDAAQHIDVNTKQGNTVTISLDVNGTKQTDINDAQFIWNMYNAVYDGFDTVSELTFLKADLNGDKKVDILDAQTVMAGIK